MDYLKILSEISELLEVNFSEENINLLLKTPELGMDPDNLIKILDKIRDEFENLNLQQKLNE